MIAYYTGDHECDFIVTDSERQVSAFQVSYSLGDKETEARELRGSTTCKKSKSESILLSFLFDPEDCGPAPKVRSFSELGCFLRERMGKAS